MNYSEMLNKLIDNSGKMLKDICSDCKQYGVDLNPTYLSVIKREPTRIPSQQISRAIAKACGAKYSEVLVVQACLDKAPEALIKFLEGVRELMTTGLSFTTYLTEEQDEVTAEQNEVTAELNEIKQSSLAEFICEYADKLSDDAKQMQEELMQTQQKEQEPKWLAIPPDLVKQLVFISDSDIKKQD